MNDDTDCIRIRGACENNLKNVSLDIPKNRLVVFAGVSGSGKSSLAFGTIAVESARQWQNNYSLYIRNKMPTSTLSGGEVQRVKLASELGKRGRGFGAAGGRRRFLTRSSRSTRSWFTRRERRASARRNGIRGVSVESVPSV